MSEIVPRTGTPCTRRPFLVRSSSTMQTGLPKLWFFVLQRLTAHAPALPAPTMSNGVLSSGLLALALRIVRTSRHRNRTPAMAAVLNTAPKISTAPEIGRLW